MATTKAITTQNGNHTELAQFGEMSVQTIVDRKRKIREVLEAVMVEGEHYGKIPGCGDKPSLFKAGAEVLATTFGLAPKFEIFETNFPNGHREYRITCTLTHIATGANAGEGVGVCSTLESKYRWRNAQRKCPKCGAAAIMRSKYEDGGWYCFDKRGGCGAKFSIAAKEITEQEVGRVENPDIADQYNTVLKIAKKRAQVDCTLTAVGASDVLTQDLEDLPPGTIVVADTREASEPKANGHRDIKPANSIDETALEDIALELIAEINECKSPDAVRALAKRFTALPKGSRARANAHEAYNKRIADTSAPEAA